ncbi:30S ribosomal protein S4 [Candidatus Woesearchaeota archaeon]|jgi:small subunit ribosomal protein S4|nr:30S ribosomal protein S4 [Candidatus Woesearchaeota archaeon]MBT4731752.1 30S ribosomal protein S4 [Candidatus Woesearchaeota archaeon]MBT4783150.1 30S ribosomal protein S4 [Candidatus Woesearchaeota archaeon]MBT5557640.1 30S ribosomal protein S4 [Candidatus Woesearchaeota archaeon]
MGIVRKPRKKYSGPSHPWEGERIEEERILTKEYGLKNKKEIWKLTSKLSAIKKQAKRLVADTSDQGVKEQELLIKRLISLGILTEGASLDDILEISVKQLLARRLQSMILTQGIARTSKQARQMIAHGHITVNANKTNIPSYLVKTSDDLAYAPSSPFTDNEHPELVIVKKEDLKKVDVVELPLKEKPKETPTKTEAPKEVAEVKEETKTEAPKEVAEVKEEIKEVTE